MTNYNLTVRQKEVLQRIVEGVKSGQAQEPLIPVCTFQNCEIIGITGTFDHSLPGDLDVLCEADLLAFSLNGRGDKIYTIKQSGYDAVENKFIAPNLSISTQTNDGTSGKFARFSEFILSSVAVLISIITLIFGDNLYSRITSGNDGPSFPVEITELLQAIFIPFFGILASVLGLSITIYSARKFYKRQADLKAQALQELRRVDENLIKKLDEETIELINERI